MPTAATATTPTFDASPNHAQRVVEVTITDAHNGIVATVALSPADARDAVLRLARAVGLVEPITGAAL